jgi:hypothetical protein
LNRRSGRRDQQEAKREVVMLKPIVKPALMILSAAAIAAVATFASLGANGSAVAAGPLAAPQATAIKACADRPWPYLNCVGTRFGNPSIRLVTTDRLR